jgi:hypothetical protein
MERLAKASSSVPAGKIDVDWMSGEMLFSGEIETVSHGGMLSHN